MYSYPPRLVPILLAGLVAAASTPHAFALEADAVGTRLKEALSRQRIELDYDSAMLSGSDVTLEGVTLKSAQAGESLPLGTLVLEDVREREDGSYRIETVELENFEQQEDGITVSMTDLAVSGLVVPPDGGDDPFGGFLRFERVEAARLNVKNADGPIATAENLYTNSAVSEDEQTIDMNGAIESFWLDLGAILEGEKAVRTAEELGYQEVTGNAVMEGSWRASDGRVTLSRYEAAIDDAGMLTLMLDLAGYTPEFFRQLEESGDQPMQGMAMLGMQQLTFHGAAVRFVDDGLAEKGLAQAAREQGSSPEDIVSQLRAAIPLQLSPLLGEELAGQIADAVGTFLESPDSIEISARPASPLPFAMLMGAAMVSPEMLAKQIELTIVTNE